MNTVYLTIKDIDRIIEMAWEDRTTFEAIEIQFGLKEKELVALMRKEMKAGSFKTWRTITNGVSRFRCKLQKTIALNKISKR